MTKAAVKPVTKHAIDAIPLLNEDHKKIKMLFADFAKLVKTNASNTA